MSPTRALKSRLPAADVYPTALDSDGLPQRIIESVPAGIVQISPDGAILFANSAAVEFLGLTYDELSRMYVADFNHKVLHEDGRECPLEEYPASKCLATGRPQPAVILGVQKPDSDVSWGLFSAVPLPGPTGKGSGVVVTFVDITKRKQAEEERDQLFAEVQRARDRLEVLSRRLVEVQEAERRRIARELHDEIGQELTALKLNLDRASGPDSLHEARTRVDHLLKFVRELSLDLRPTMLDDLGLLPALHWYFDRYTATSGVRVNFKHNAVSNRRFSPEIETAVYRVIQEALTNVVRHSGAAEATVRLWASDSSLAVQVEDLGTGFDVDMALAARDSSGLSGMRERAALLGGRLHIESAVGSGTHLTAEFPIHERAS